jgi:hypothetical protein
VPAVAEYSEQVAVAVPPAARTTFVGHEDKRADGDDPVSSTLPEKPERLENVIDSVVEVPALKDTEEAPEMLKSVIVTLRTTAWLSEPLVPVILRL